MLDKSDALACAYLMSDTKQEPKTPQEAIVYFSNPDNWLFVWDSHEAIHYLREFIENWITHPDKTS